jgi:peroxiredoxin
MNERPPDGNRAAIVGLLVLLAAGLAPLAGCAAPGSDAPAIGSAEGASHPMVGRMGAEFVAQGSGGEWLPSENWKDKPLALLFFRPGTPGAADIVRAFAALRLDRAYVPTIFLGLGLDTTERLDQFLKTNRLILPTLRDPGRIARDYEVADRPTVILLDSGRTIRFRMDGFPAPRLRARLEAVAAALRALPTQGGPRVTGLDLAYTANPRAPLFRANDLRGRPVDLAALKGKVVVLVFFDQDCPHCEKELPVLAPVLREFRGRGVAAIGIASRTGDGTLAAFVKKHGVDFPVIVDAGRGIFDKYESTRTPDTFFIDRDGFIRYREHGDRPDRATVTRLQLRLLLGEDRARLAATLPAATYSGDGTCRTCHQREYNDWLLTPHSVAWDSLQQGEKFKDPECVRCHVTGIGKPGGFVDFDTTRHMINLQCEVCHGPGGGHPGRPAVDVEAMGRICADCHTGKFVLNFDVDEALALMAHQDHPDLEKRFKYSDLQRRRLEQINTRRLEKFKSGVAYIGADACRDCHQEAYAQWERTPHAATFARLIKMDRGADPSCNRCHVTGAGGKGGFGDETATAPMTNVQCEVCHGPGADHLAAPDALKKETIYGITDQCSFCIIQGVCVTCHDRANDPDFDIEKALPLVQHGGQ